MEVLSDMLRGLRATGSVYFCDFLTAPWKLEFPGDEQAKFHYLQRGRCRALVDDWETAMATGDLVFSAPGVDHSLSSEPADAGSDGAECLLLCGYCRFDAIPEDPLLAALPRFLLMRQPQILEHPWLERTLGHLAAEYRSQGAGSELTVDKLTEVLLVELIRADFGRNSQTGVFAALADSRLRRALTLMHEQPGQAWTLERLADEAAMSRSAFARQFKTTLGMPMFDYLTRLRMRHARELLTTTRLPVADIAERAGYRSDLSFVKTFKKLHGMTPRAYRHSGV